MKCLSSGQLVSLTVSTSPGTPELVPDPAVLTLLTQRPPQLLISPPSPSLPSLMLPDLGEASPSSSSAYSIWRDPQKPAVGIEMEVTYCFRWEGVFPSGVLRLGAGLGSQIFQLLEPKTNEQNWSESSRGPSSGDYEEAAR